MLVQKEIKAVYLGTTKVRPPYKPRTFTISRTEQSNMSSGWTYSDDAAGLTAGDSAFDDFFGYYGCRLNASGVETATVTQASSGGAGKLKITDLGTLTSGNNVMIAFPRMGIKMSKSGSSVTLSITQEENKSGYQYYAFTRGTTIKDKLYIGAYAMSSGCVSLSGKAPEGNVSRYNFYDNIINTYGGNGYTMLGLYQRWFITALYMMKYGNPDSRTLIGRGYVSGSAVKNTGATNSILNATYGTSSTADQMKIFGLEDWWGNSIMYVAYCMWNNNKNLVVDKTNTVHSNDQSEYHTSLGGANSGGWISSIIGTNDGMFAPNGVGGSDSTYYRDRIWANTSRVVCAGGNYGQAGSVFTLDYTTITNYYPENGTRLMFL